MIIVSMLEGDAVRVKSRRGCKRGDGERERFASGGGRCFDCQSTKRELIKRFAARANGVVDPSRRLGKLMEPVNQRWPMNIERKLQ